MKNKKKKTKVVWVYSAEEMVRKIKYARRGTIYVLIDKTPRLPMTRSEIGETLKYLEKLLQFQSYLGVRGKPAVVFKKEV